MTRVRQFVLAAGGTGGHMVPAAALAAELKKRGHKVDLISDERGVRFPGLFDGIETHVLPAGRMQGGPLGWYRAGRAMLEGRKLAIDLFEKIKPAAVIGFGGYPALPALLAGFNQKVPTAVHEQNAVLGRVNRLVAGRVDAIATSYAKVDRLAEKYRGKAHLTGNPVREDVLALRDKPYPLLEEDSIFRVLVTGGSQGASILSSVVPDGLSMLPVNFRRRLQVTHQARVEDIDKARAKYAELSIAADLATYLPDLPEHLAWAHLVIARAGASTIAELTAAGRPAILVPLPIATDDHQTANAREMAKAGGARMIPQPEFTPEALARQIEALAQDPQALANAAARSLSVGRPNAARDLADLVERIGGGLSPIPVGLAARTAPETVTNGVPA